MKTLTSRLLNESKTYQRLVNPPNPLSYGSKFWLSPGGTWYLVQEHAQASLEMETDIKGFADSDDWLRVVYEAPSTLFFEGSPERAQIRELKQVAALNRLELKDDFGTRL